MVYAAYAFCEAQISPKKLASHLILQKVNIHRSATSESAEVLRMNVFQRQMYIDHKVCPRFRSWAFSLGV